MGEHEEARLRRQRALGRGDVVDRRLSRARDERRADACVEFDLIERRALVVDDAAAARGRRRDRDRPARRVDEDDRARMPVTDETGDRRPPVAGRVAPLRACSYASRPRSIAVAMCSRWRLMNSRPCRAASDAISLPSLAFSLRTRRVSSPLAGASSRAIAAPARAPSTNVTTMVAAAPPSSLAIDLLLEDADPNVQILFRVLADVGNQAARLARGGINVLI